MPSVIVAALHGQYRSSNYTWNAFISDLKSRRAGVTRRAYAQKCVKEEQCRSIRGMLGHLVSFKPPQSPC